MLAEKLASAGVLTRVGDGQTPNGSVWEVDEHLLKDLLDQLAGRQKSTVIQLPLPPAPLSRWETLKHQMAEKEAEIQETRRRVRTLEESVQLAEQNLAAARESHSGLCLDLEAMEAELQKALKEEAEKSAAAIPAEVRGYLAAHPELLKN